MYGEVDAWYLPAEFQGQHFYGAETTLKGYIVRENGAIWSADLNEVRLTYNGAGVEISGGDGGGGIIITVEPGFIYTSGNLKTSGTTRDLKIEPGSTQKFASVVPPMGAGVGMIIRLKTILSPAAAVTQTCPDGTVIPLSSTCPSKVVTQTCSDGTVIPITSTCPGATTKTCSDGSTIPVSSNCPSGTTVVTTEPGYIAARPLGLQPIHMVAIAGAGIASVAIVAALVMTGKKEGA